MGGGTWILGGLMTLLGLLGLIMASRAQDDVFHFVGLVFFLFSVLFVFTLIGRGTGKPPQR